MHVVGIWKTDLWYIYWNKTLRNKQKVVMVIFTMDTYHITYIMTSLFSRRNIQWVCSFCHNLEKYMFCFTIRFILLVVIVILIKIEFILFHVRPKPATKIISSNQLWRHLKQRVVATDLNFLFFHKHACMPRLSSLLNSDGHPLWQNHYVYAFWCNKTETISPLAVRWYLTYELAVNLCVDRRTCKCCHGHGQSDD